MTNTVPLFKNRKAVIFDLFHTLTSFESTGRPGTADILGINREIWNKQFNQLKRWDELINEFNDRTGLMKDYK